MKITAINQLDSYKRADVKKQNNIPFKSNKKETISSGFSTFRPNFTLPKHQKEFIRMQKDMSPKAKEQLKMAIDFARKYGLENKNISILSSLQGYYYVDWLNIQTFKTLCQLNP